MRLTNPSSIYLSRGRQDHRLDKPLTLTSKVFGSPIYRNLYPTDKTARFYGLYQASDYLIKYQIASGLSLGVFDTEYEFKHPDSVAAGGKLHFDLSDDGVDEAELLRQMDVPLASIACAFDAFHAMDNRRVAPVTGRLPASASFHEALTAASAAAKLTTAGAAPIPMPMTAEEILINSSSSSSDDDEEDEDDYPSQDTKKKDWAIPQLPTAPGQVLQRMGTATRADAAGAGLMRAAAHCMMRRAAAAGFRGIRVECFHDAVAAVWTRPPPPFRARVAAEVDTYMLGEVDGEGRWGFPYRPVRQRLTRVWVALV